MSQSPSGSGSGLPQMSSSLHNDAGLHATTHPLLPPAHSDTNDAAERTVQLYAQYRQGLSPLPASRRCSRKLLKLIKEHFGDCYRDPVAISRIPLLHFGFYVPIADVYSILQSQFPAEWKRICDLASKDNIPMDHEDITTTAHHRFAKTLNEQLKALPAPKTNIEGPVIFIPYSTIFPDEGFNVYTLYSTDEPPRLFSWERFAVAMDLIKQLIPQREPMWFFPFYYCYDPIRFDPFDAQKVIPELAQFVADVRAGHYDD